MGEKVMFVHGMFVTPKCWAGWVERFAGAGYECLAPGWPAGREGTPAELRARHPDAVLGRLTLDAIVDHYAGLVRGLASPPLLVGHSMGGLVVQLLLQRGLGAKGVAIDSAPPRGVSSFAWSFVKSNWPVISPFAKKTEPVMLTPEQFAYAFVHTRPVDEQRAVYEAQVVPESRLVGWGPTTAAAAIEFAKPHAPLLMIAGELDHIIPASLNRKNVAKYRDAGSGADFEEMAGRTHNLIGDPGWEEVADVARRWMER